MHRVLLSNTHTDEWPGLCEVHTLQPIVVAENCDCDELAISYPSTEQALNSVEKSRVGNTHLRPRRGLGDNAGSTS